MIARASELGALKRKRPGHGARDRRLHGRAPQGRARRARARGRRDRRPRQLPPAAGAARAPRAREHARSARRRQARQGRDLRGPVRRDRRRRRLRLRHDPARLRQVLHVLRRAVHARPRARHAAARGPAPGPRARRAPATARSCCSARPSTRTSGTTSRSRSCCARWRASTASSAIRFTSPYPVDFTDDVIAAIAEEPKLCKYVHLPVQSGSDVVLERMRRGYTVADYRAIVARAARARCPTSRCRPISSPASPARPRTITQQTLALMREIRFDSAFMFAYSERDLTFAAKKLPDDVPPAIKQRRLAEIVALQEQISAEVFAAQVGRRERVLVHGPSKRDPAQLMGRTDGFKTVILPGRRRRDRRARRRDDRARDDGDAVRGIAEPSRAEPSLRPRDALDDRVRHAPRSEQRDMAEIVVHRSISAPATGGWRAPGTSASPRDQITVILRVPRRRRGGEPRAQLRCRATARASGGRRRSPTHRCPRAASRA